MTLNDAGQKEVMVDERDYRGKCELYTPGLSYKMYEAVSEGIIRCLLRDVG